MPRAQSASSAGAAPLGEFLPALIAIGVAVVVVLLAVWLVRRARRGPRARARAEVQRSHAGVTLVELDDAIAALDVEVGLSGALFVAGAPQSVRRGRLSTSHSRDDLFVAYRDISVEGVHPSVITRTAKHIDERARKDLETIARARATNASWMHEHVDTADQLTAATDRLQALRSSMGDPAALVLELSSRFDASQWQGVAAAARDAEAAAADAEAHLGRARSLAGSSGPSTPTALEELVAAERALRRAHADARALEESHRLITQAALALPNELVTARAAIEQAQLARQSPNASDRDRLGAAMGEAEASLEKASTLAARHPTQAIAELARLRERLDLALGSSRTAQQRLRGARAALPTTIAAARTAVAQADVDVARSGTGADARVRLLLAQQNLAGARQADDPVVALDAARRAIRHADDARALAATPARGDSLL